MKILLSSLMVLSFAAGISSAALADDTKGGAKSAPAKAAPRKSLHDEFTGQGYGLAGCGLGSVVFGPKPGLVQVVAATTNDYFGQTFAITTGTSNCDIPEMGQQAAAFIEVNKEIVMKDAARGQGETIDNISAILKCTDSQVLGSKLQKGYEHYFTHGKDSYETTRRILNTIKSDADLKLVCAQVG